MAELKLGRVAVWEVVEQGYIGQGKVSHGVFSTEEEAARRFQEVAQRQPGLLVTGSLGVSGRQLDVVEEAPEAKMLRAGRDYEDKARAGAGR